MNRAERRAHEREMRRVGVRLSREACERCGAPICPSCRVEAEYCDGCGEHHCPGCGLYVRLAPGPDPSGAVDDAAQRAEVDASTEADRHR